MVPLAGLNSDKLGLRLMPDLFRDHFFNGQEVFGELVISGGHPTEVLQLGEEALDQVAIAVEEGAEGEALSSITLCRDVGEFA